MHPLLARRSYLSLYLLLFLLVGGVLAALLAAQRGVPGDVAVLVAVPVAVAYAFVCLSAWYVARGVPLAGSGTLRVVATALTAAAVSSGVWMIIARLWMGAVAPRVALGASGPPFAGAQPVLFGFGLLLYLFSLAVSYVLTTFEASQQAQQRVLRGQVFAREAELRSLRAQLDPHFLFNSLHSISALTTADPPAARRMCLLLAELLRESLGLGGQERITLAKELSLAEKFLAIERVRFGDRLRAEISSGDAGGCLVPPLLLQPIVENAVTHGVAHLVDGGTIRISARRRGAALTVVVENPCDPDRARGSGAGVGLANVRARLRALHGAAAGLVTAEEESQWRVELTLPAEER
jgi:hypothetical protein